MVDLFEGLHPVAQALLGGSFTWLITAIGASLVLFTRRFPNALLDSMLGFAAGVMIAASVWSLIIPAIEISDARGDIPWLPAVIGFALGGVFLRIADKLIPHLHLGLPKDAAEGPSTTWKRTTLLVLAITLHNIPEGLAVGVAFGAVGGADIDGDTATTLGAAVSLAIGIGLQNFPEGLSVAMPLRREGFSRLRSFTFGHLSAAVEPVAAVIGALAVVIIAPILPYALAFAAGAMIYVVVEELIPESQTGRHADVATIGTMVGFAVMMVLDVSLS